MRHQRAISISHANPRGSDVGNSRFAANLVREALVTLTLGVALPVLAGGHCGPAGPDRCRGGCLSDAEAFPPYAGRNFPTEVFWGGTHLHTGLSFDAGAFGARLGPEDAYRFARGEEVTSSTGLQAKLSRPLDFLVVADQSDNMGFSRA